MKAENDKMYEAYIRMRMVAIKEKKSLRQSVMQCKFGSLNDLSNMGYAIGRMKGGPTEYRKDDVG